MTDALRSIKYPKVRRGIIVVSFIILVIWIIVVVLTVLKDQNAICGSNRQLNLFTYIVLPIAFIGLVTYWKSVDSQLKLHSWLRRIPMIWDYLMDSGDTPYFNPEYYKLKNGRYSRVINNTIESDEFGLPIVDNLVPLNSFNMNIYKKYHKPIFDEINAFESSRSNEQKVFKRFLLEHTRIAVVGRKCMIVKSWSGEYLLIHKSKYLDFIDDQRRSTRWEDLMAKRKLELMQVDDRIDGLQYFIKRLNGLPHSDKTVSKLAAKHSNVTSSIVNHYEPLLKEMGNVYICIPASVVGLKDVVKQLSGAPKKPFSAPLLTTKHLELKVFDLINNRVRWSSLHQLLEKTISTNDTLRAITMELVTPELFITTVQEDHRLVETKQEFSKRNADLIEGVNSLNNILTKIGKEVDRLYTEKNANYIQPIRILYQYNNDQLKPHLRAYVTGWSAIHGKAAKAKNTFQNVISKFKRGPVTDMGLVSNNVDNPDDPVLETGSIDSPNVGEAHIVLAPTGEEISYNDTNTGMLSSIASVFTMPGKVMQDLVSSVSPVTPSRVETVGLHDQAVKSVTLANNPKLNRNLQSAQSIAEITLEKAKVEEKKAELSQGESNKLSSKLHECITALNVAQQTFPNYSNEMFNTEKIKALHITVEEQQKFIKEHLKESTRIKQESINNLKLVNDKQRELDELRGDVNNKAKQLIDVTAQTVKNYEQLQLLAQKMDEKDAALIKAKSNFDLEEANFRTQNINDQHAIQQHEAEQARLNQKIRQAKLEKDQAEQAALAAQNRLADSAQRTANVEEELQRKTTELQMFNEQSQQMLGQIASLTTSLESFEEKHKQMLNKNATLWFAKKIGDKKQQKLIEQHEATQAKLKKEVAHATAEAFMSKVNLAALDAQYKSKSEKEDKLKKEIDTKRRITLLKAEAKKVAALNKLSKNNQALLQQYEQTKTQYEAVEREKENGDARIAELMSSLQAIQTERDQLASTQISEEEKQMERQRLNEQTEVERAKVVELQEAKAKLERDAASYKQYTDSLRENLNSLMAAEAANSEKLNEAQRAIDEKVRAQAEVARVQEQLKQNEREKQALREQAAALQTYKTQLESYKREATAAAHAQQEAFQQQLAAVQAHHVNKMEEFKAQCIPIIANLQKFVNVSIEAVSVRDDKPVTIKLTNDLMVRLLKLIHFYDSLGDENKEIAKPKSDLITKLLFDIFGSGPKDNYLTENPGKELTLLYSIYKIIITDSRFDKAFKECEKCKIDLSNEQFANQYKFLSNCQSFIAYSESVFNDTKLLPYIILKFIPATVIKSTNFPVNNYNAILNEFIINSFVLPSELERIKTFKEKVEAKKTVKNVNPHRPPREAPMHNQTTTQKNISAQPLSARRQEEQSVAPATQSSINLTPRRPPPLPSTQSQSVTQPINKDNAIPRPIEDIISNINEFNGDPAENVLLIDELKDTGLYNDDLIDVAQLYLDSVKPDNVEDYESQKSNLIRQLRQVASTVKRAPSQLINDEQKSSTAVVKQVREEGNTNPQAGDYYYKGPPVTLPKNNMYR